MTKFDHVECGRLRAVLEGLETSQEEIEVALWYTDECVTEDAYNDDLDQRVVFIREVYLSEAINAWYDDRDLINVVDNLRRCWSV